MPEKSKQPVKYRSKLVLIEAKEHELMQKFLKITVILLFTACQTGLLQWLKRNGMLQNTDFAQVFSGWF